jgi:hypothetical protein
MTAEMVALVHFLSSETVTLDFVIKETILMLKLQANVDFSKN